MLFLLAGCAQPSRADTSADAGTPGHSELVSDVVLIVKVEGDGRDARLEVPLPSSGPHQSVVQEAFRLRGFRLEEVNHDGNRLAVLTYPGLTGPKRFTYKARVITRALVLPVVSPEPGAPTPEALHRWVVPTPRLQSRSPAVRERLIRHLEPRIEAGERDLVRLVYELVSQQYERRGGKDGTSNVLKALRTRIADDLGLDRLFVTFLRTAGIPARNVGGVRLAREGGKKLARWTEVNLGGAWVPFSVPRGWYGSLPPEYLPLYRGDRRFLRRQGVEGLRFKVLVRDVEEDR